MRKEAPREIDLGDVPAMMGEDPLGAIVEHTDQSDRRAGDSTREPNDFRKRMIELRVAATIAPSGSRTLLLGMTSLDVHCLRSGEFTQVYNAGPPGVDEEGDPVDRGLSS